VRDRKKRIRCFALVIAPGILLSHGYLISRLVVDPGLPAMHAWPLLAGGLALLTGPFVRPRLAPRWRRAYFLAATSWLGIAFVLFTTTVLTELALGVLAWLSPAAEAGFRGDLADPRAHAALSVLLAAAGCAVGLVTALRPPRLRRVEISLGRWPAALDGFRIVHLSDLHLGPLRGAEFAREWVGRVNALGADLVVITGDLVDGSPVEFAAAVAPLGDLRARHGVFFVTGNHEHAEGADPWVARLEALGLRALRNQSVPIGHGEASFVLAGVEDRHARALGDPEGENLAAALRGSDPRSPVVLLAHNPSVFREAAAAGVDLQLSGHTHGGQIWPFGAVVRCFVPWVAGLYESGQSRLYVSRGTGFWGPPLRLFAPGEIVELRLRAATSPRGERSP
jgi:hypothetical protein